MLKDLKEKAIAQGMSLLSSPAVTRIMENEKVGEMLGKAMNLPIRFSAGIASQREKLADFMQVASQSDVDDLKRTIARLEDEINSLRRSGGGQE